MPRISDKSDNIAPVLTTTWLSFISKDLSLIEIINEKIKQIK